MRKFVMSDIHGFGNAYYSMMNYLDNVSRDDEVELYINGDLIDRGPDSADIFLDVMERIKKNKFRVIYLGGNHELMMYQELVRRMRGTSSYFNDWYLNGGSVTDWDLEEKLKRKNKIVDVINFVGNLKIYQKFKETIDDKKIVLVHAACPKEVLDECNLTIKDDSDLVDSCVWSRKENDFLFLPQVKTIIGNKNYFSIVGHTPNESIFGFAYNEEENYLNIDGGCAMYVSGYFESNHFPLVEIKNGYLRILTFNDNNEITYGNYFVNNRSIPMMDHELMEEREYLNKKLYMKKMVKNEDGVVYYQ